jgi:NAD(P)-dependent dehydrogenase (short-subunit alcohol dehydrogenase family)
MSRVLVTGANRGLGLELTRQYAAEGWQVIACCRTPGRATALQDLADSVDGRVTVRAMDVTDSRSIGTAAEEIGADAIDLLINNAGVMGPVEWSPGRTDYAVWSDLFDVNVLAPMRVIEAFVPALARGQRKLIVTLSSRLGSVSLAAAPFAMPYRTSKAAVNMAMRCAALALAPEGISCVVVHPGWVRTDMGGSGADLAPSESVTGLRRVIDGLGPEQSGQFFNHDGAPLPW